MSFPVEESVFGRFMNFALHASSSNPPVVVGAVSAVPSKSTV